MSTPESSKTELSDEIDLGQVFTLMGRGLRSVFRGVLRVFLYFKKNFFWLLGLAILGGITGFLINKIGDQKFKQDVIITPGPYTTNYFYDAVSEIQANLEVRDTVFFQAMGIDLSRTPQFKIEVTPLRNISEEDSESDTELIKLLRETEGSDVFTTLLEEELMAKATRDHRITFYYKNREYGEQWVQKIISYINSNPYYGELLKTQIQNTSNRIQQNDSSVGQIDRLINAYTEQLKAENPGTEGRLVLENQESLDIPALMELKNEIIASTENKKLELNRKSDIITIVNTGRPHNLIQPLFRQNVVFFPLVFIGVFALISLLKFLNRRAEDL